MTALKPIENLVNKKSRFEGLNNFLQKAGSFLELLLILSFWFFIFWKNEYFSDYSREEFLSYLLIGNFIGLIAGLLLHKVVSDSTTFKDSKMIYYKPIKYLSRTFFRGFARIILPFLFLLLFNSSLIYFFRKSIVFNLDSAYLSLIIIMMILSFIIELLLAFFFSLHFFWIYESGNLGVLGRRLKKLFAGAYFPLNILPPVFLSVSMFLPFAYAFYVPTQLYFKKLSLADGIRGLLVQAVWIVILYIAVKITWNKKVEKEKKILQSRGEAEILS